MTRQIYKGRAKKELLQGEGAGAGAVLPQKGEEQQITLRLHSIDCYQVEMMKTTTMMMTTWGKNLNLG